VLYTDRDATVRAAAARRLGDVTALAVEGWLIDAIGDRSPLVRDAIVRSLARRGGDASRAVLRRLSVHDRMWFVRRAAIYALAAISPPDIDALTAALADPFWRVRHAAVQVLALLGARDAEIQARFRSPESSAETFLRAAWGPVAIETPARAADRASRLPEPLRDPDPAVVTARLAAIAVIDPLALVELLCDPHAPLRWLAMQRLIAAGDVAAFEAAMDWLEEPRIPHVVDTVHGLLDGLGDTAAELARRALARPEVGTDDVAAGRRAGDRPGAARWAIEWVVATRYDDLRAAVRERARRGGADLRAAAVSLIDDRELAEWAGDPDLVDAIATELHDRRRDASHDALLALDGAAHPRTRALQIDVAARRAGWDAVGAALADPHHGPRAIAARWLVKARRLDDDARERLMRDPDPAVREAVATPAMIARGEVDPWTRRAAMRAAIAADIAVPGAHADDDPWIRAGACAAPATDDDDLARVLDLAGDPDPMVQAAAHEALDRAADGDRRVRALLGDPSRLPVRARTAAYAWLLRALDEPAAAFARDALATETAPAIRVLLGGIAGVVVEDPVPVSPRLAPRRAPAVVAHRPFGRAGWSIAPLAISGVFEPSPNALAAAEAGGVDLYFWEPGYRNLARFLRARVRRDSARVITGSYHAERESIEADVDRALRNLRRDAIDVFLLFWTRSPARVDDAAFVAMERLRRSGKVRAIGFSTHHRDLARTAIETHTWDTVMIRHSAAHPGIERELLPVARERGTAIVTFSALCYGRMLAGPGAPSAQDCYRYSLSQPGVTACISAPRRHVELIENLAVLARPELDDAAIEAMRVHGVGVRAESQRFNTLMRQPTRDAAAAAREMLAAELPPESASETDAPPAKIRMPRAGASRGRSALGRLRRPR
jgi:diketogulonate reductase-like aldo/keto reductase/HEAT repeat protein